MVTPYFSKLSHGHTCLLNAPSNLIFTATRIVDQRTEVYKTLNYFTTAYSLYSSMIIMLSIYDHNLGRTVVNTKTIRCTMLF
ncbi:unnamed protein product [Callosobruchus maculatus]|uniref:Uncharacterized protein n=1 Tax=Callosobruchus maculatus TaxID=64391 RepID=A0A653DRT9_CALMS|nr:unnamed protein product [Callosobruchus maculatus]